MPLRAIGWIFFIMGIAAFSTSLLPMLINPEKGKVSSELLWVSLFFIVIGPSFISEKAQTVFDKYLHKILGRLIGSEPSNKQDADFYVPMVDENSPKESDLTKNSTTIETSENETKAPEVLGQDQRAEPPDVAYRTFRDLKHQIFDYTVPTYILDQNAYFQDWNFAFEFIFSSIIGQIESKHAVAFISRLMNKDAVMEHAKRFTLKDPLPLIDTEPLRYYHEKYGQFDFIKIASQLHNEKGKPVGWAVVLNILRVRKEDEFRKDWLEHLTDEKIWSVYSPYYDPVLKNYPGYDNLLNSVVGKISSREKNVADLGAGTGNVTEKLLEKGHRVWAIERNPTMLDQFRAKTFSEDGNLKIIKASVQNLEFLSESIAPEKFDAAVAVNVLYALEDPFLCLRGVNRILKLGGHFVFSTTHEKSDLNPLLQDIQNSLDDQKLLDKKMEYAFNQVKKANQRLYKRGFVTNKSESNYKEWIEKAGFFLEEEPTLAYQKVLNIYVIKKVKEFKELGPYIKESQSDEDIPLKKPLNYEINILVVEDQEQQRIILMHQLERMGLKNLFEAENRPIALEKLKEEEVDLIIADRGLPNTDEGIKFFKEVREMEKHKRTPFIMLTAYDSSEEKEEAVEAGIEYFMNKPYGFEDLRRMIKEVYKEAYQDKS